MKHQILNRFTGKVIYECAVDESLETSMKLRVAVLNAIEHGINLRDADLRGADLRDADLRDADLRDADLRDVNLSYTNLRDADLRGADLRDADLRDADLRDADLRYAKNAPKIILNLRWFVSINGFGMMRIGCQFHEIEKWRAFSDEEISKMDSQALAFWKERKSMLLSLCDTYKHN